MSTPRPSLDLVTEVLAGQARSISRMISRAEASAPECRPALAQIYRHTGRAHVVGITGVPGSGKSTLVRGLALAARPSGRRVGVIAIDPSSPYSGGAILGDRIRMNDLNSDPGIFIRSMATRGALGGLARASLDAVDLLDAAGFDIVLLETVGVGQDEVDVVQATHTTVVVSAPGLGDDIQAIKAGILEIADIHVVSKCDRPDAKKTVADLKMMLGLGVQRDASPSWQLPVVPTSGESGTGVDILLATIDEHRTHPQRSGEIARRRKQTAEMRMLKTAEDILRSRFVGRRDGVAMELLERVIARDIDPHTAALQLLAALQEGEPR
ncbi:MAG: methylmalonyl Co-A mutase-associated GTPase MeaB [Acidiferrobacterales bacterium]